MNDQIISKLSAVINTLNMIPVSGKQSMMRLCGCIDMLEEICGTLSDKVVDQRSEVK